MKKLRLLVNMLICCCFSATVLATPAVAANLDSSVPESDVSHVGGNGIGYREEVYSKELVQRNTRLMWHPDFDRYQRVDGYFFGKGSSSASVGISLGGKTVNVSFSYTPVASVSGIFLNADINRDSRPAIYGDVYAEHYWSGNYNFNTKTWVTKNSNTRYKSYETRIVVEYR